MTETKASSRIPGPARAPARGPTPGRGPDPVTHAARLLAWYDRAHRRLPWRADPGKRADPYRVWLSEIMLQQTTVAAVIPYFERFTARWPDVGALAAAPLDDVLAEWQGLGYYARARNLVKCAQAVAGTRGGRFPDTEAGLMELPGIGPYTAAAIAAIAFGRPAVVVDGNVERVAARLFAVEDPVPDAKPDLRRLAGDLTPGDRAGDYAQAMMDLGATICTPRSPACTICPVNADCAARLQGIAADLPKKRRRANRPTRLGIAWCAFDPKGRVLLRRRPEKGLLGGMMEVPSTPWTEAGPSVAEAMPPAPADWESAGTVEHVFTHFRLVLEVRIGRIAAADADRFGPDAVWAAPGELASHALPTAMKKVLKAGFAPAGFAGK